MIERKVWQCEHCKKFKKKPKVFFDKSYAEWHERKCLYNLENRSCFTCKHNETHHVVSTVFSDKKKGNKCKIGQNWRFNNHMEYCNKPKDSSGLEPIYQESDFFLFPVTMQIVKDCTHWEYVYKIEEGEQCED